MHKNTRHLGMSSMDRGHGDMMIFYFLFEKIKNYFQEAKN
jgi:hypothetical protein